MSRQNPGDAPLFRRSFTNLDCQPVAKHTTYRRCRGGVIAKRYHSQEFILATRDYPLLSHNLLPLEGLDAVHHPPRNKQRGVAGVYDVCLAIEGDLDSAFNDGELLRVSLEYFRGYLARIKVKKGFADVTTVHC